MKKISALALGIMAVSLVGCGTGIPSLQKETNNVNEIAPYPSAEPGFTRSVIYLPQLKDEQNAKVELVIGKDTLVDCNVHGLSGKIEQQEIKGWGYNYYVVSNAGKGFSTLMACSPDQPQKMEFVTMNNNLGLLDYNSRLPIVVYAPQDMQVKYRVWSNNGMDKSAIIEN